MAIKSCKECGKKISTKATVCPSCGYKKKDKGCLVALVLSILTVTVIWWSMGDSEHMDNTHSASNIEEWKFSEFKDSFDDSVTNSAYMKNPDGHTFHFSIREGYHGDYVSISIHLNGPEFFVGDNRDNVLVRYRIDDGVSSDYQDWKVFDGKMISFFGDREGFIDELLRGNRILISISEKSRVRTEFVETSFSLVGLGNALSKLKENRE